MAPSVSPPPGSATESLCLLKPIHHCVRQLHSICQFLKNTDISWMIFLKFLLLLQTLMTIEKYLIVSHAGLKTVSEHFHKHRSVTTAQN